MKSRGQLRIKVECIPVHLGQPENFFGNLLKIGSSGVAAYCKWRGYAAFPLEILETRMQSRRCAMNPHQSSEVIEFHGCAPTHRVIVIVERAIIVLNGGNVA